MPLKAPVQKLVELKQINVNNKEKYYPFDAVLSSVSSLHHLWTSRWTSKNSILNTSYETLRLQITKFSKTNSSSGVRTSKNAIYGTFFYLRKLIIYVI